MADNGQNGHVNGTGAGGSVGGAARTVCYGVRASLAALQREVMRGDKLSEAEAAANIRFAVAVRDDPNSVARDKLRAIEVLEAMRARGINTAMYLDGKERLESGEADGRVEHTGRVALDMTDPRVRRAVEAFNDALDAPDC